MYITLSLYVTCVVKNWELSKLDNHWQPSLGLWKLLHGPCIGLGSLEKMLLAILINKDEADLAWIQMATGGEDHIWKQRWWRDVFLLHYHHHWGYKLWYTSCNHFSHAVYNGGDSGNKILWPYTSCITNIFINFRNVPQIFSISRACKKVSLVIAVILKNILYNYS